MSTGRPPEFPSEEELPLTYRNIEPLSATGHPPEGAPHWIQEVDHPYLHGLFAPVTEEIEAKELWVEEGSIPTDLAGLYVVNGPNQRHLPVNRYHYYDGDGMLHGIYFNEGKACYRSRWIRTYEYKEENRRGRALWPGLCGPLRTDLPRFPIKDNSNTDLIYYGGQLLSLWYLAGSPYAINPWTLKTHGRETFDGQLAHNLSAHSKVDPHNGELRFFNYQNKEPYMSYGVADPSGNMIFDTPIELPGPRSPHDMGLSRNYTILQDLPYFQDEAIFRKHKRRVVRFHQELPARFGIVPRHGGDRDVRWFEAEPCYMLHVVNSWEEGRTVVLVGCRIPNPGGHRDKTEAPLSSQLAERRRVHELYEWRFNLDSGGVSERQLDDTNTEFPTTNRQYLGTRTRYSYHQLIPTFDAASGLTGRCQTFDALVKYDLADGSFQRYNYGLRRCGTETHFAPRVGGTNEEDDGYLVTFVHDAKDWTSRCLIFDARDIEQGPLGVVRLPRRIPVGFHALWVAETELPCRKK